MVVHATYPVGETRVQRQASILVEHGFEVDVVCLRGAGEPRRSSHDGVTVYRLPVGRHRGRGFTLQLAEYLCFATLAAFALSVLHLRRRYQSVQVHNLPDFLVFAAALPKATGARLLLDLHDLMPEFFSARAGVGLRHPLVRVVQWQERLACRFADDVITVTEEWRRTLIDRGVPSRKVSVIMNVADARIFNRGAGSPAGHSRNGRFHLVYHGTFTHRYGVDLILEAAARLRAQLPGLTVTLQGDGELRDELCALRARLGLTGCVVIRDRMEEASTLPGLLRSADAGVVPNRSNVFTDGLLPTKLMEYVAMGVPVIASRTPTVAAYFDADMVEFFEPGDVADLAAAIRSLAADQERRRVLAENADAFNRKYGWEAVAATYASLIGSPVAKAGARRAAGPRRAAARADRAPAPAADTLRRRR